MTSYHIDPIGFIHSPYSEKFAVPRQPNLVSAAKSELHLLAPYNDSMAIKGLEQFSHLWLLFIFNHIPADKWNLTVRPPRLGGNKTMGVFATRSPFRPNHIGMSAVELIDIEIRNKQVILKLGSLDLVNGTPIIDIKPYIPYCDSYPDANAGYAQKSPEQTLIVILTKQPQEMISKFKNSYPDLEVLIKQVIAQDPRPAYKKNLVTQQTYGIKLYQFNIIWQVVNDQAIVLNIT